ncbi:MAG: hypothetical protein GTO18_03475 [Anaerolineales bacterium]|nr:hypothetical protein [Anaerolineales bacterium]
MNHYLLIKDVLRHMLCGQSLTLEFIGNRNQELKHGFYGIVRADRHPDVKEAARMMAHCNPI